MLKFRVALPAVVAGAVLLGSVDAGTGQGDRGDFIAVSAYPLAESASGRRQPNECDVMVQLHNKHLDTIDNLTLDMAIYLRGSPRPEIRSVYFRSITPSHKEAALVTLSHRCPDVSRIVLQEASNCRVAGESRSDCLARIETVSGGDTQIAVEK